MKITKTDNPSRTFTYLIEVSYLDLVYVPLTEADRAVIDECGKSGNISDTLLALHVLARALEKEQEQCHSAT